jgi:phosphatidylglycerol:prolipoprotein diacylglycerol transferase
MVFFEDKRTFLRLGPLSIQWYAILILAGAFLAYMVVLRNFKKLGYDSELGDNLFIGALFFGVIGSRLWFVAFYDLAYYLANPLKILMTWEGGLAIQGGLLFGFGYAYWYLKRRNINFMRLADAIVPSILIAQSIGRWGNFANQEAYGNIVDASFYDGWPVFIRDHMFINNAYRVPTFLYESVLNIVGFFLITFVYQKFTKTKRGDMVYAYLMWYGVTRFFVEGLRTDSLMFFNFRSAQLVSIIFIIVGVLGTLGVFRKFTMSEKPVIIFDFDGTLLDTEPIVKQSMVQVIQKHRPEIEIDDETASKFVGPTLKESFSRYFEEHLIDDLIAQYREISNQLHYDYAKPLKGVMETLKQLKEDGYKLGVVSSKMRDVIIFGMDFYDMEPYFDVIIGLDDVSQHKPHPEGIFLACEKLGVSHDSVVFVGDTAIDVQTGNNAGVYMVAFMSNPTRETEIMTHKPNELITDMRELLEILRKDDVEWTRSTT